MTILHNGTPTKVIVHSVSHYKGLMWRVWVQGGHDVFANGDKVYWTPEPDEKAATFVRDLRRESGEVFFALVAIEG